MFLNQQFKIPIHSLLYFLAVLHYSMVESPRSNKKGSESMDGPFQYFPFPTFNDESDDMKLNHDRYEVYVNGDFVGTKPLLAQNDTIEDLDEFLQEQGLTNFQSINEGDHFEITSADQEQQIKEALHIHLQNR